MTNGSGQFPIKIPIFVVFGAMKIKKVLEKQGGRHKGGIEFLSEVNFEAVNTGDVYAAF